MPRPPSAPSSSPLNAGIAALLVALSAVAGCAPRALPASFPPTSAASPSAPEAIAPKVGVALLEDPPPPGEPVEDWPGLGPDDAGAARAEPLTADAAVRLALLNNRELRAALREVGVARGRLTQAGLLPNPELSFEVMPRRARLDATELALSVEYDVTSAILAPLRERAAAADLEAARYRAAGATLDLGYAVRAAFYAAQAAQQRLAIANQGLDAFAAGRDAARALFEAGNTPALDAAIQEAVYEAARVTASQIEVELVERRERLNRLLGRWGSAAAARIRGEIPDADEALKVPPRAEARALAASIELAEMRSRVEAASGRAGLSRAQGLLPDLSVGVRGEREDEAWRLGAGLRLTLPIFDRKQGAAAASEAEFESLVERYHGLAIDVRSALREARARLTSAHLRARHYKAAVVPARRRVSEQALLQYNAMQIGVFQLLEARRGELDARLAEVEARREYWTAKAAFEVLLAGRRAQPTPLTSTTALSSGPGSDEGGH